jgi:spore coat polysaccharide biosynthesis protein SpsF (cytidylyltransferase family)
MTKVVVIIQSRQGSTRLPGKAIKPLYEKKGALELIIERLSPSRKIDQIIVATTESQDDDVIEALCKRLDVACYRGSVDDVLDRYFQAAKQYHATHIVRLTADCPFQDYAVVDALISDFTSNSLDYESNSITPTYPDGFDAEIFTVSALEKAKMHATLPSEKEHVTAYIYKNPDIFSFKNFAYEKDYSYMRLTMDTVEDFQLLSKLAPFVYGSGQYICLEDILDYINERPHLLEINKKSERNEGYQKSLEQDGVV